MGGFGLRGAARDRAHAPRGGSEHAFCMPHELRLTVKNASLLSTHGAKCHGRVSARGCNGSLVSPIFLACDFSPLKAPHTTRKPRAFVGDASRRRKAASRITSMVAIAGWTCRCTPQSQTRRNRCGTCTLTRYPPSPIRHRSTLLSTACGRARGLCDGATTLTSAMCSGVQAWGLCAAAASGGATRYLRFHPHACTETCWQVENGAISSA